MGLASFIDRLFSAGHSTCQERLAAEQATAARWQTLAEQLLSDVRELNQRLLLKERVMALPEPPKETAPRTADPLVEHEAWVHQDERAEIEEYARKALYDPEVAALIEQAAEQGIAEYVPIRDRLHTLQSAIPQ